MSAEIVHSGRLKFLMGDGFAIFVAAVTTYSDTPPAINLARAYRIARVYKVPEINEMKDASKVTTIVTDWK